jgi:hypothetical protein
MPQSHFLANVVGQIVGDKAAQFVAERQLIRAKAKVHRAGSVSGRRFFIMEGPRPPISKPFSLVSGERAARCFGR